MNTELYIEKLQKYKDLLFTEFEKIDKQLLYGIQASVNDPNFIDEVTKYEDICRAWHKINDFKTQYVNDFLK